MSMPISPPFPADALILFPFTVGIKSVESRDRYNQIVYSLPVLYSAHIEVKRRLVVSAAGEELVSNQTVYLASSDDIPGESVVIFPDGSERIVMSTTRNADEFGWFITTVYV
jgi:hypothetical protein